LTIPFALLLAADGKDYEGINKQNKLLGKEIHMLPCKLWWYLSKLCKNHDDHGIWSNHDHKIKQ
jgi:hypothetical protein